MTQIKIPTGWKEKTLGDDEVSQIIMGQSPPSSTYNKERRGIPFYQGKTDFGDKFPTPSVWCDSPKKIAKKGDILISVRAPVGPTNWAIEDCCIGRGLAAIRPKIEPSYLYYYLKLLGPTLLNHGTGSTFKAIGKSYLHNIPIPVAPLEIQRKVVQKLDDILTQVKEKKEAVLELKEKQIMKIKNLNSTFQISVMQKYIPLSNVQSHWKLKKLSEIADVGQGGTPSRLEMKYWNGTIPWLRSGELLNNRITDSKEKITKLGLEKSSTQLCPKGTILMAMTGQGLTRGRTAFLEIEACANQSCAHIINKSQDIMTEYLWLFLQSRYWIVRSIHHGSGQPGINTTLIKQLDVLVPPLDEQKQIIQKINQEMKYVESINSKLKLTLTSQEKLRSYLEHISMTIMDKAFSGQLVN